MKRLLLILFIGITGIGFGQSSQEIIDAKTLLITAETDSLLELRELANKKIDAETEKINRFEDSLVRVSNYTSLVKTLDKNDSILDYLNKKVTLYSKNTDSCTSSVLKLARSHLDRDTRIKNCIMFYNQNESVFTTCKKYLIHDSVQTMVLGWGFEKLYKKLTRATGSAFDGRYLAIPYSIYVNWVKELDSNGYKTAYPEYKRKIEKKMDIDDNIIVRTDYFSGGRGGLAPVEFLNKNCFNPFYIAIVGLINSEKLKKVITEYNSLNKDKRDAKVQRQEFWDSYFQAINRVETLIEQQEKYKKFSESYDSLLTITKPMRSSRSQIENKLSLEKKSTERKISNLRNEISSYERIINRKDERILKVQSDEVMRVKLISEADSLMQINNYEIAISKYKQSQKQLNYMLQF
jgi:hypothetical protein